MKSCNAKRRRYLISKKATLHVQPMFLYVPYFLPLFSTTTTWNLRELLRLRANGRNNFQQCCANNVGNWNERVWPQQRWRSCANGSNIVALRFGDHATKQMLGVVGWNVWPVSNFAQQHATTPNRVCKRMQHVTSNNVGSCWPTMLPSCALGLTKALWAVFFPGCTAGPRLVESCCIRLHTTANTHATTPNIFGATMLGVVAPVCTRFREEMLYVFSFTFFSLPPIFTSHWWPLAFLILPLPLQNFYVVLSTKKMSPLLFLNSRSRSLSPFSCLASLNCRLLSPFLCLSLVLYSKFVDMTINLSLRL